MARRTRLDHNDIGGKWGPFRKLDLIGPAGRLLARRGIECRWFGIYLHRIEAPDPGLDLHDHPWPFVSLVLRGGYGELRCPARDATRGIYNADWRLRWTVRRFPLTDAHRIDHVDPDTVTLVIRGRRSRRWGFYTPDGWVDHAAYDYDTRRPVVEA